MLHRQFESGNRNLMMISLLGGLILSPALSSPGGEQATMAAVEIRAATQLKDDDDVRIRSELLGCHPCDEVKLSNGERYLVDPRVITTVRISDVQLAYVAATGEPGPSTPFELILQLSDEGARGLREALPTSPILVVNSYGGRPIGVSTILLLDTTYSIASFASAEAARGAAAEMGLQVKEIPFDQEAAERLFERLEGPE